MKNLILLPIILFILTGCNAFLVASQLPSSAYLSPPTIQHWQKKEMIGHTNTKQRWQDLQHCGIRQYLDGNLDLSVAYPDLKTNQDFIQRKENVANCMNAKGYIYLEDRQCVDYDKEKITGFCN